MFLSPVYNSSCISMAICSFGKMGLEFTIRLYKSLMLQNNLHNIVYAELYVRGYFVVETSFIAVCAYCSIRLYHAIELSYFLIFPMCTVLIIVQVIVVTTVLAQIYETSTKIVSKTMLQMLLIESGSGKSTSFMKKIYEKEIAACYPLRSWIGSMYFMKKSTKLVFLGFILNFIIFMLLTF